MAEFRKIFVLYPRGLRTGGPEALHQLVHVLRELGQEAFLTPLPGTAEKPVIGEYSRYSAPEVPTVEDRSDCAVITPETALWGLRGVKSARRFCWWLSIDNSRLFGPERRFVRARSGGAGKERLAAIRYLVDRSRGRMRREASLWRHIEHLSQSHYAWHYLHSRYGIVSTLLTDYTPVPEGSLNNPMPIEQRGLTVAFNPAKGGELVAQLAKAIPSVEFIALAGMPRETVQHELARSSVYLDLGHHPGKDRLPREAALGGALVLAARQGAAANHEDMPIPWQHKISMIGDPVANAQMRLAKIFEDIRAEWDGQESYRRFVETEPDRFRGEVKGAFLSGHWGSDAPGGQAPRVAN